MAETIANIIKAKRGREKGSPPVFNFSLFCHVENLRYLW